MNEPELVCYGDGINTVPTIHIDDLVTVLVEVVETTPETRYLVAVDDAKNTLFEIVKAVADTLGSGVVKKTSKDAVFLNPKLSPDEADMLQLNLKIDAGHIKEMNIDWKYEVIYLLYLK